MTGQELSTWQRETLENAFLPKFLSQQRWFGDKERRLETTRIIDHLWLDPVRVLLFVQTQFAGGATELYVVYVLWNEEPGEATEEHDSIGCLIRLLESLQPVRTPQGELHAATTPAYSPPGQFFASAPHRGEQSNTSLIIDGRYVLKLVRRLQPGPNPDVEIGRFLLKRARFRNVPALAGWLEYQRVQTPPITLAILQSYVPSECTGWEMAMRMLRLQQTGSGAPEFPARLLGQRTAELHLALASETEDREFRPEPLTPADVEAVVGRIREHLELVRPSLGVLAVTNVDAQSLLEAEDRMWRQTKDVGVGPWGQKIRVHGDYHLGQVLWTGEDYWIIDFEGEPTRPLDERRAKHSPLKDVAGMLRSFDYAAQSLLRESPSDETGSLAESMAEWCRSVSSSFLKGYRETTEASALLPPDIGEFTKLLDLFLLDKVLYELHYELNNRPDWVEIPLRGILARLRG
jgi:maltose alpha-D-glucosyltransferase/alpha-amylase